MDLQLQLSPRQTDQLDTLKIVLVLHNCNNQIVQSNPPESQSISIKKYGKYAERVHFTFIVMFILFFIHIYKYTYLLGIFCSLNQ